MLFDDVGVATNGFIAKCWYQQCKLTFKLMRNKLDHLINKYVILKSTACDLINCDGHPRSLGDELTCIKFRTCPKNQKTFDIKTKHLNFLMLKKFTKHSKNVTIYT